MDVMEWIVEDLITQIFKGRKLKIRSSLDESCQQLHYNKSTLRKLAVNSRNISQIYQLIVKSQKSTLRDLYYDHKHLFARQDSLNRSVSDLCQVLNMQRCQVNVISCSKGLVFGRLCLTPFKEKEDITPLDCSKEPILISEKLIDDNFFELYPRSILVTGKGYPDLITRQFLSRLIDHLNIPIHGLFDADPHGMEIFLTYKYGSSSGRVEGRDAIVPSMKWMGLKPSERDSIPIAHNQLLAMSNVDYKKSRRVKRRAATLDEDDIVRELDCFEANPFKMELEALSSAGHAFLPRFYISPRLKHILAD